MTTDIATYQGNGVAVAAAPNRPMRLVEWAAEAEAAHQLAAAMCATSFCPEAFRNKPGEATAAIMAGSEVGLSPIASLNAYDVIQGRPAPKAMTLRALVQSAGHDVWLESSTPNRAVMMGRRRGSSQTQESIWTLDRARQLGVANKPNWKSQAQAMLVARATSEIARLVGADVILGIPYSSEELADLEPEPTTTTRRADAAPSTTARRRQPPPVQPEPDLDPPAEVVNLTTGEVKDAEAKPKGDDTIDPKGKLMRKLQVCFTDAGIDNPQSRHQYAVNLLGRPVDSTSDLTTVEASRLINALELDAQGSVAEPPLDEPS